MPCKPGLGPHLPSCGPSALLEFPNVSFTHYLFLSANWVKDRVCAPLSVLVLSVSVYIVKPT